MTAPPRFVVELVPVHDVLDREPVIRLRMLLKLAWRTLGLRCVRIIERPGGDENLDVEGAADG